MSLVVSPADHWPVKAKLNHDMKLTRETLGGADGIEPPTAGRKGTGPSEQVLYGVQHVQVSPDSVSN